MMSATFGIRAGPVRAELTRMPSVETVYDFGGYVRLKRGSTGDDSRTLVAEGNPVVRTSARYTNNNRGIDVEFIPVGAGELYKPLAFDLTDKEAILAIANALRATSVALKSHPRGSIQEFRSERQVLGKILGGLVDQGIVPWEGITVELR